MFLSRRSACSTELAIYLSLPLARALFFQWSQAVLAPLACSGGGWSMISPSSTGSLPYFLSFFLFFSTNSRGEDWRGARVRGLGRIRVSKEATLTWDSRRARRLEDLFWITIPSSTPITSWSSWFLGLWSGLAGQRLQNLPWGLWMKVPSQPLWAPFQKV